MARGMALTVAQIEQAIDLRQQGLGYSKIGKVLGVARTTVWRYFDPAGYRADVKLTSARYRQRLADERALHQPIPKSVAPNNSDYQSWIKKQRRQQDAAFCRALEAAIEVGLERAHIGVIKNETPFMPKRYAASLPDLSLYGSPALACSE
jgi:hypothetical protein